MKRRAFVASVFAGVLSFSGFAEAANVVVGTGSDYSFFVLESPTIGSVTYEVYYNHNPLAPLDSYALLQIIDSAQSNVSFEFSYFGPESGYFLNSITWNGGAAEANSPYDPENPGPYWSQWAAGGSGGYPAAGPIDEGSWTYGSGLSAPFRTVVPGSWDGLVYSASGAEPSVAPVPEPSAALLAVAGGLVFIRRRRAA